MTSQEKIEELYYKAVQDAKLAEPKEIESPCVRYSVDAFSQWARKIDIYTLTEGAADFSKEEHKEIVNRFGEYRTNVALKLSEEFRFDNVPLGGNLRDIGSCKDGSKVGSVNEMDSLLVMQSIKFTVKPDEKHGLYHVFLGKGSNTFEIKPRKIRNCFADKCSEIISKSNLPSCLEHGGYNPPSERRQAAFNEDSLLYDAGYRGVRYNGPAVTSQFLVKDKKALLTWDVTPVVVLRDEADIQAWLMNSLPMQAIIDENPDKMFSPPDIHLFPDATEDLWRLSTAHMEADILCRLPKTAPFKEAFSSDKVLASSVKEWGDRNRLNPQSGPGVDIVKELLQHQAIVDHVKKMEATQILNDKMRYAHIWIPTDMRTQFHEDKKSDISINNAAIKHILLKAACRMKGAFASERNPELVKKLIQHTFEVLGNDQCYSSDHAFLEGMKISHFSVAPIMASQKVALARSVSYQCRILRQEAMTEPCQSSRLEELQHEMNRCTVGARDLIYPEYSFELGVNPWQHPVFDKNIHCLLTLVTALCNGCGGIICLVEDESNTEITGAVIETFQSRLLQLMEKRIALVPKKKINFTQTTWTLGHRKPWVVIHVKKTDANMKYAPNSFIFCPDLNGKICVKDGARDQVDMIKPISAQETTSGKYEPHAHSSESSDSGLETERPSGNAEGQSKEMKPEGTSETDYVADFSLYDKLVWTQNKKGWENYVTVNEPTIEKMIAACPVWEVTDPMSITPNKDTLKCLFESPEDMEETLSTVDMKEPGFAVVCKTWKFHVSNCNTETLPTGHICDILTVSARGRVSLWVICNGCSKGDVSCQMEYLLVTGRLIKYQLINKVPADLSNLCIECHLFYPTASATRYDGADGAKGAADEIFERQNDILRLCGEAVAFESLQRALALVILSKESPLKRDVSDKTTITLSAQQAKLLLYKDKVNYVSGPAGSGKSWTAAYLCNLYGKNNSVYVCTTTEFVQYLSFSGYTGTLIESDQDLLREIQDGTFKNKTCVIVDDSHNFTCSKASMEKLFQLLKDNKKMSLFVFADNDYQAFDKRRQQAMRDCIRELSLEVLGIEPYYTYLHTIYRNPKSVVSFVQSVIQDSYEWYRNIECGNTETGEGIECIRMPNLWVNSPDNSLVAYLGNTYISETYSFREIAVLFDPSYTAVQIEKCRKILRAHIPDSAVQTANIFPRRGVVVDHVEKFLGLDAPLCIFILSQKKTSPRLRLNEDTGTGVSMHNPRFKVFMATRATHKAVFVVANLDAEIVDQLKFDCFGPPVDFRRLAMIGRFRIPRCEELWGFCSDNYHLYSVEDGNRSLSLYSSLFMYDISKPRTRRIPVLDKVIHQTRPGVVDAVGPPRIDRQSKRIYVPCGESGVMILRLEKARFVARQLKCVTRAVSVAAHTLDTIFVCDSSESSVKVVSKVGDTVIRRLKSPAETRHETPWHVAVLNTTVLVCYGKNTLVKYATDVPTAGELLGTPAGLISVSSITTDGHSSFLVTDSDGDSVFILDEQGNLRHRIRTGTGDVQDCAVVGSQLWLGYRYGEISVMASE